MKINMLKDTLKEYLTIEKLPPLMIWGPPGVGKSSVVAQVAKGLHMELIDLRVSLLESIDLMGLPSIAGGKTQWNKPSFLPTEGKGLLFLDEINLGTKEVLKALYQLLLDRKIADYTLPDGWYIICAGNRAEDGAAVTTMPKPLLNRLIHVQVEADVDVFCTYILNKYKDDGMSVAGYLQWRPDMLLSTSNKADSGFPTPRSWEVVVKLKDNAHLIEGAISLEVASEYLQFRKLLSEIKIEDLLENPKKINSFSDRSVKIAAVTAVAGTSLGTLSQRVEVMKTVPEELGVLGMKLMYQLHGTKLLSEQSTKDWVSQIKGLLF